MKRTWIRLALLLLFPLGLMADPEHFVLVRYSGPDADKYRSSLVALVAGDTLKLRTLVSSLPADASGDDVIKEARRFACDMVLTVTVTSDQGKDTVEWSLASPDERRPRASGKVTKPQPNWSTAADIYWVFLADPIAKETAADARPWPVPPVAEQAEFTVVAKPGTLVSGLPGGAVVLDGSGKITKILALPVSISLQGHLPAWITTPVRVFVDHPDQQVTLEQKPAPAWSIDVALNNFSFPSLGVEWRPWNRLTARFMIDQYLGGILFKANDGTGSSLPFQSLTLMTVQLGAAWDWSWPEDSIRFYTGVDIGTRIMFPQYTQIAIEPIAPVTIEPLVGWEYHWTPGQAVYFEGGPALAWVAHKAEYEASISKDSNTINVQIGGTPLYMAIPLQAKVGYRWFF